MRVYDTITDALTDLDSRGYNLDFNLTAESLACKSVNLLLKPEEFEIEEVYRFEGMTDPADSAVVYAISSNVGILVDGYGVYAENISPELLNKLKIYNE
ncbi:phosphoribosylpyrophosphate synthetase [Pedobacter sp. ISL-68]|uniref:phosphoribosylpyrophosphate synthetase n=1 Tax=unclassified Pedobacter TaxID=2628915 RepID=UPI001BEAAA9D|nr:MULTISPECIES: phosphoribosylpyrophosphate synthetase [unclassified Pedobacter]MBT2561910.1 phosphoribosylpyrophosphate synthetase [Pedobacter sp. ISL-64]MBT2591497.1 phosphoribosylpyrophosphate synthetase [Pedobacter sp. ISL-68]